MSDQFLRKATLLVAAGTDGLDLSAMQFQFAVNQSDIQTPATCKVRVFNLSDTTVSKIQTIVSTPHIPGSAEYARLIVQGGYQGGNFGVIFDGSIKQVRRGRISPVDTYLDILAADADLNYNYGVVDTSIPGGSTPQQQVDAIITGLGKPTNGINVTYSPEAQKQLAPVILPRGKVLFGLGRDLMRDIARSRSVVWSLNGGTMVVLGLTDYLPGEAVVLTAKTGMVGLPVQTDNGIQVRCLLNPLIRVGTRVQIDNKSIQTAEINVQYAAINQLASVSDDGFYRVMVAEHFGDTRGNEWYSELTCLVVDPTAPVDSSVKAYG